MPHAKPKSGAPIPEHKWSDCLQAFDEMLEANERSTHTRRNYRHDLHQFQLWYEHAESNARPLKTIGQVNAVQFREWKAWLQRPTFDLVPGEKTRAAATATVNRRISAMHSFLEWAFNTRRLEGQVEKPKVVRQKRLGHRGMEKKDERDLLDKAERASPRDRAIIHVFLYSGLRADELARMKWSNLKINGREWGFLFQGKGDKTRYVPAHPKTVAALKVLGFAEHRGTDR
ncbi:MAG: tyrosine-type recombinase/integrase, partial [Isosphaeraceae bacterium]